MNNSRLKTLFKKYLNRLTTKEETKEFFGLTNLGENRAELSELMSHAQSEIKDDEDYNVARWDKVNKKAKKDIAYLRLTVDKTSFLYNRKLVAAATLAVICTIALLIYKLLGAPDLAHQVVKAGIHPGIKSATLTLSDGREVLLKEAGQGEIANEGGVRITKNADGTITYLVHIESQNDTTKFNTLSTANGQTFQVILPDGTKVWLNAASSIKYPSSFSALQRRRVELRGEAYFEVAKNPKQPFMVESTGQQVEVMGTHFNVDGYDAQNKMLTTLLEGRVQVTSMFGAKQLNPGEQLELTKTGAKINTNIDLESVIAWKEGYFKFDEDLESVMAKISRWYNVEVNYQIDLREKIVLEGKIQRSRELDKLLKALENTSKLHFKIEGKKIIVSR